MKRKKRKILIAVAVLVLAFVVLVATRPGKFRIVRSTPVAAPTPVVFDQVNDFHNWKAWSPWAKRDPAMKQTYDGPAAGTGAVYTWDGNSEVGSGRMTITESRPGELITIRLDFYKPMAGTMTAHFTFKPEGAAGTAMTAVTWDMTGERNFLAKLIDLVMNMDKMIGGDFEKGLAGIKTASEAMATTGPTTRPATPD